ncbi:MAG TPA: ferritin-like domain-containing protein [Acidobacteriaceae bacterium]|nr:ferritin-like domain-containing protein [Acidobacteriaceae bacterium]
MASNEIEVLTETSDAAKATGDAEAIPSGREVNRRRFLAALGVTGAVAGAGMISGCTASSTTTASTTSTSATQGQVDALNFALNLKYLSATVYSFITTGADISTSKTKVNLQGSGAITGTPGQLTFTGNNAAQITDMVNEIYYDEWNHVVVLQNALGSSMAARPAINLAAFGAVTATNALSIARALEDLNVTALAAVVALLQSSNITLIEQILGADSFHAGALRLVSLENASIAAFIKMDSLDVPVFDPGTAALAAAGPSASGGFFATAGASAASASYPAGMAFNRTASQSLAILYGSAAGSLASAGAKSGGFFPSGMNGAIISV